MTQAAQTITVNARFDDDSKVDKWKIKNDILHFEEKYYILSNLLRRELLKQNHDDFHANHFEYEKILELLRRKYWWLNMSKNVKEYVISCTKCFLTKSIKHKFYELLQSLSISQRLRKNWTMNFIIDLSLSKRREQIYDVILIIIDRYTKYFIYISARKNWTTKHLTNELFDEIFFKQEMSKFIIFDKDSLFTFNFWSNFCYHLRIKIRLNIVFHFQTDEQTKRQNQTLEQYLKIYVNYQQDNWARLLFVIEYVYNNSWHSVIKMSSFTTLYWDDDISRWKDQIQKNSEKNVSATWARVEEVIKLRDQLYKRLKETRSNQVKYYNEKHTSRIFNVEDKILLNFRNIHTFKSSKKLDHKYYESFEIEEFIEKQAYKLRLLNTFRIHNVFHVSLLKSYKERFDDVVASSSIIINEEKHDEMKLILNSRLYRKRLQYFVKWLSWSDIENQWVYAEDVQADELIKNFHQQYFNKLSIDASNAKRRRIEKNWFNQRREEFHFNRHEVESQLNYQLLFEIQRQIKHLNIVVIVKTTKRICNVFQKKLILFVSFYELTIHIIDIFSINFLSLSRRKIWAENSTLTSKNLRRNDLITYRDSSVNQLEDRISKSNRNLALLKENLQKMRIEDISRCKSVSVWNILHTRYRLHDDKTSKRDNT